LCIAKARHYFVPVFAVSVLPAAFRARLNLISVRREPYPTPDQTRLQNGSYQKDNSGRFALGHLFLERLAMSQYLQRESAVALVERRPISWRVSFDGAIDILRAWIRRRQHRQELLAFMDIDHRAAADMGVSANDARDWAERPFWRP
jgi:uncharacterized protein YjiS (DUF1127 family)